MFVVLIVCVFWVIRSSSALDMEIKDRIEEWARAYGYSINNVVKATTGTTAVFLLCGNLPVYLAKVQTPEGERKAYFIWGDRYLGVLSKRMVVVWEDFEIKFH